MLWIDATDTATVRSSFERRAMELDIAVDSNKATGPALVESAAVQAVLRWLRNRKDTDEEWLVIVDNIDNVPNGLNAVIPKGQRGNIIVTSRDRFSPMLLNRDCQTLEVGIMSVSEANALLLRHLKRDTESVSEGIRKSCDLVVQRLGCLALAIDLAGAYIGNEEADQADALVQYAADYDKYQDELLRLDHFRGLRPTDQTV